MAKPIWITIDGGDSFEGHQLHFADTFFSNATKSEIENAVENSFMFRDSDIEIRDMSQEEIDSYPGLQEFVDKLED